MPRVRLFNITRSYGDYNESSLSTLVDGLSEWEEVTEEELKLLQTYLFKVPTKNNYEAVIVIDPGVKIVQEALITIRGWLEIEENRTKKEREEAERKKRERAKNKAKTKEQKEKELLEELLKKYGEQK